MEENSIRMTFPAMFNETLRKFGKKDAYAFVGEEPKSYERVNQEIQALIAFLEKNGILPGRQSGNSEFKYAKLGSSIFFSYIHGCGYSSDSA